MELKERPRSGATGSKLVAKKSTGQASKSGPGDRCRNVSRKSTGAGAKFWPETKINQPYSFYRIQPDRFDPKLIKTRMAMGEFGYYGPHTCLCVYVMWLFFSRGNRDHTGC